jgi:dephospho-CoA kinase
MDYNVIGIVGPIACGKGIVVDYLKQKHEYISFSLSSILHDELKKRGVTLFTRTTLQDLGDELRKNEGDGVLAKRAIKTLNPKHYTLNPKIIIEGIRNPGEVHYLRTIPGFFLIAVDAQKEIRYQRVLKRGKPWDPKDWESFISVDGRDGGDEKNTNGQQVRKCMELADIRIENNGNMNELMNKLKKALFSRRPLHTGR